MSYASRQNDLFSSGKYILVLSEKQGDSYYNPLQWGGYRKLLAHLFRESDRTNGWYPTAPPRDPGPEPVVPMGIEDMELAAFWADRLRKHAGAKREYRLLLEDWENYEKARAGDEELAAAIFERRRDFEYEGFRMELLQTPPG